jgi:membrane protease YdiL (CAAX protease family)
LPALLSALALLFRAGSIPFNILLWVLIFGLCGFAIPWGYVLLVERRGPAALGISCDRWVASVVISVLFAGGSVFSLLRQVDITSFDPGHIVGAAFQLNVGGLFEIFLYCGFLHLRLRDAFGPLSAIIGSAALYSLWHIGTELPLHPGLPESIGRSLGWPLLGWALAIGVPGTIWLCSRPAHRLQEGV